MPISAHLLIIQTEQSEDRKLKSSQ